MTDSNRLEDTESTPDTASRGTAESVTAKPRRLVSLDAYRGFIMLMLAASGFAFAASLGEFGATSFLARDDAPTVPVVIFRLIGHPGEMNYGMALAASVVLATATAIVVLAVERLRVPSVGAF